MTSPAKFLWRTVEFLGGTHARYQQIIVLLTGVLYMLIIALIIESFELQPILIGSLIGAFPIVIFEANRHFQRPYLTITSNHIVKYPDRFHILDPIDMVEAENAVCIHAVICNQGRETAEEATIRTRMGSLENSQYYTRWADENEVYRDIAPGERQTVHLMWIDLENEDIELPTPDISEDNDESQYPPGDYERIRRWEISKQPIKFDVVFRSKNTPERIVSMEGPEECIKIEQLIKGANEWDAVKSIKSNFEHYAVVYERYDISEIHVPQNFDFGDLKGIDEFNLPDRLDPKDAVERTHEIVWIDDDGNEV
ncbi:hypothetical protein [Haloarchaeobius sp. HME9146]|uniref:hypothetical protein n=1 Tax=Haloarchaeobius sp. HME9146 TaxID=2978732 RepID=UPI0021C0BB50|nr:hypothetical protein [Haloarchaeobius sp. HME9146]MCT9096336.1 hypothetical protein [Haloarchaeobius sp. HME9146]